MDCPGCKYPETRVIDTRQITENKVRRRRQCIKCGLRISTEEQVSAPRKKKEPHRGLRSNGQTTY